MSEYDCQHCGRNKCNGGVCTSTVTLSVRNGCWADSYRQWLTDLGEDAPGDLAQRLAERFTVHASGVTDDAAVVSLACRDLFADIVAANCAAVVDWLVRVTPCPADADGGYGDYLTALTDGVA